jgi:8-oxo-dGTP pyrophosphatase MutT (NUDIX family)
MEATKFRKVACIVFYDDKKNILIQDRRDFSEHIDYGWFGGGIEKEESPETAVWREIKEELDINLKDFKLLDKYNNQYKSKVDNTIMEADCTLFITKFRSKNLVCHEGKPIWVTINEARTMLHPGDVPSLDKVEEWLK